MLPPKKLEAYPVEIIRIMESLQEWVIGDIAHRVAELGVLPPTAEYQLLTLAEMSAFESNFKREVSKAVGVAEGEIESVLKDAAKTSYIIDSRFLDGQIPFQDNAYIQQLLANVAATTKNEVFNITQSLGFAEKVGGRIQFKPVARFYQDTLDLATMQIATGVTDYNTVIKNSVKTMANSGLRTVTYASGVSTRIDVATRRAVFGGLKNLTRNQARYNADIMDTDVFEISWHSGHRPTHGWGGLRYSLSGSYGYPTQDELYDMHGGGSLSDYGCLHDEYAVYPDSPSAYAEEELTELESQEKQTKEFRGKEFTPYEAKQAQRKYERSMRNTRLEVHGYNEAIQGAGEVKADLKELKASLRAARTKYSTQRTLYKEFSKKMGLSTEFERVYYDGLGRVG